MKLRAHSFVAAALGAAALAAMSLSVVLATTSPAVWDVGFPGAFWALPFAAMALIGAVLIWRRSANATGWVLAVAGLLMVGNAALQDYTFFAYSTDPPKYMAATSSWLAFWTWVPASQMLGVFFLLFPTGSVISRAWRPVLWGAIALVVATAASAVPTWESRGPDLLDAPTMAAVPGGDLLNVLGNAGFVLLVLGGLMSLVVRYRRGAGVERQQMRWLLFAAALNVGAIAFAAVMATIEGTDDPMSLPAVAVAAGLSSTSVPIAAGIAILKYRLYDIDVVINKTLVYGSLAAFITAVYVGVVVGIGTVVGQGDSPNLGLSILATAVVAVAFQPVRERVQRLANRLVYGKRATPYEVLSEFGHRMASTYAAEEVLPRMARILAEGTGAKEARVWLKGSGELTPAALWPDDGANGSPARPDGADLLVPVTHRGEDLGALSISKAPGERLTPAEEKLAKDLASQAGLVLRNVKLIEDLKASRVRLVQAQDEERRRIERNIHDGAQQQLVAVQVKLGLTKAVAMRDRAEAERLLAELQEETSQALQDLRDLARGIYPPLLADKGLAAALEAQARKSALPVTVHSDGIARYPQDAEAAVYFCVLEALQNVAKYAGASRAMVRLGYKDGSLSFQVTDDGAGFDPASTPRGSGLTNMADRLAALGGDIDVRSRPGEGTTVRGRVPIRELEPAP